MGSSLFQTPKALRAKGWIPESEASELLGLPRGEMISWDYIDSEQTASDGENWVKLLPGVVGSLGRGVVGEESADSDSNGECKVSNAKCKVPRTGTGGKRQSEWMTQAEATAYLGVCRN